MSRIVIDARSRGSTGRYATKLLQHLQQIDSTNQYFVLVKSEQNWAPKAANFHAVIADVADYTFAEQLKLWWIIRRLKPDLVHFTMPQQPLLYTGRSVTTIHDLTMLRWHNINGNAWVYRFKLLVFRLLLWWVAHTSERIITPTRWVKIDVTKHFRVDPLRLRVTYEAAENIPGKAEPPEGYNTKTEFLLFNGNVFPHKNVEGLLKAHQRLLKDHPNLRLAIAGKLGEQGLTLKAQQSHTAKVDWLDYVPDQQLKWLFANAKVYVYPSFSEGFGLPGLEAMLAGTPVASSNATCLPEVYGEAAEFFDPGSTEDMVKSLHWLLSRPQRRGELVKLGHKQVKLYSWRRMAEQTLEVYAEALES